MSTISAQSHFICSMVSKIRSFTPISRPSSKYSFGTHIFIHDKLPVSKVDMSILSFQGREVHSLLSYPFMILYKYAASLTFRVKVPGVSRLEAIGMTPKREFRP